MDTGVRQRTEPWTGDKIASHLMAYFLSPLCSFFFLISYVILEKMLIFCVHLHILWAPQVVLVVKNPPAKTGDTRAEGLIPGSGRSPGERHGNPLEYSCLENPHGQRSLGGYSPWGFKESDTTEAT